MEPFLQRPTRGASHQNLSSSDKKTIKYIFFIFISQCTGTIKNTDTDSCKDYQMWLGGDIIKMNCEHQTPDEKITDNLTMSLCVRLKTSSKYHIM